MELIELNLIRLNPDNKTGIQGVVVHNDIAILTTIERPWIPSIEHNGGANFISCVPTGVYDLIPTTSDKYGFCYFMYNPDLDVYVSEKEAKDNGGGRWSALFGHVANYPENVEGCVGFGLGFYDTATNAVAKSKDGKSKFNTIFEHIEHIRLTVKNA